MTRVNRAARLVAVAAMAIVVSAAVVTPASATGQFACDYRFQTWPGGFWAELMITNNGPAVNGWTAHWTFDNDERLGSIWNAVMTQQTSDVTATPMPWNRSIPTGGSAAFGWTAFASTTETPTDITINGTPC